MAWRPRRAPASRSPESGGAGGGGGTVLLGAGSPSQSRAGPGQRVPPPSTSTVVCHSPGLILLRTAVAVASEGGVVAALLLVPLRATEAEPPAERSAGPWCTARYAAEVRTASWPGAWCVPAPPSSAAARKGVTPHSLMLKPSLMIPESHKEVASERGPGQGTRLR